MSFTQLFDSYLNEENISYCITNIAKTYYSQNKVLPKEWYYLLVEWVDDYVGNIDLESSDKFLHKYCYRKALFEYCENNTIDTTSYCYKQLSFNRKLIAFIILKYILQNISSEYEAYDIVVYYM